MLSKTETEVRQYQGSYEEYLQEKRKLESRQMRFTDNKGSSGKVGIEKNSGTGIIGSAGNVTGEVSSRTNAQEPTLQDVFDKKTYYNPGKIKSRLTKQLEKYEKQLAESEQKAAELKMQLMDPALATDYEKLMELQSQLDAEEKQQESLLERMMETETELLNFLE